MYDNNPNNDNQLRDELDSKKASCLLLNDIAVDLKEQLYSIRVQLKSQRNLLQEKQYELAEKERLKDYNQNLFSPNIYNSYDTSDLIKSIDEIKDSIDILVREEKKLDEKINGLQTAVQCLEKAIIDVSDTCPEKNNMNQLKLNSDKGLSILEAQEIERQRIARDLHDSTVQNLTSLVHKSELCIKLIDIDSVRAKLELNSMSNTLKMVINDMRGIIYNLKPMSLDDLGLTVTVQRYCTKLMNLNNIQIKLTANEETKDILPVIKLTLFRIIQEACTNVIKHAGATLIKINIRYEEHRITVSVKDNGNGFDLNSLNNSSTELTNSFGLSIIKERISLLSGTLEINSEDGIGTTVIVSAPLTNYEGDKNE